MSSSATATPSVTATPSLPCETVVLPRMSEQDSQSIELASRVSKYRSTREFAFALTNTLCNQSQCEQVSIGIAHQQRIQVLAVSGCAQFKPESPGITDMRQAMEECLDHGDRIVALAGSESTSFRIHRQWSLLSGGSHVCSIPLRDGEHIVGVVSCRRQAALPFTDTEVQQLTRAVQPFGGLLSLVDRANRPLTKHVASAVSALLRRKRTRVQRAAASVCVVGLLWLLFGTMTYRPLCDSTVVSAELRHMTAPFEAPLGTIHVKAGDRVRAGDVLVAFDTHQTQLELETVCAEMARAEVEVRAAIEAGNASNAAIQGARVDVLMARKLALHNRIESAQLRAPADGMVVQSLYDRRLGQVFARGEPVLQFAPNTGWVLEIRIPEHVATVIDSGQTGKFVSAAYPNERIDFRIEQVNGSAEIVDEKNVFLSRAQLQRDPAWMRSGMKGVARITTVKKPVWWLLFHKLIDWTRLRFWL